MQTPKTIKILLSDGSPLGIRIAEIGNRIVKCLLIPRNKIKEAGLREELKNVGIYFLIGQTNEQLEVYIGEAENVYNRIKQHNTDEDKDFWNIAACFVAKDSSITKAHAKYIENYAHQILLKLQRCKVMNSSQPAKANLPEGDVADAMEFLDNMQLLLSTLGYPIFESLTVQSENVQEYYCKGPDANAKGLFTDEGFVVLEGSLTRKEPAKAATKGIKDFLNRLKEEGIIVDYNENSYIFKKSHLFKSPSMAAVAVLSRNANGWTEWKDVNGKTLSQNERE